MALILPASLFSILCVFSTSYGCVRRWQTYVVGVYKHVYIVSERSRITVRHMKAASVLMKMLVGNPR